MIERTSSSLRFERMRVPSGSINLEHGSASPFGPATASELVVVSCAATWTAAWTKAAQDGTVNFQHPSCHPVLPCPFADGAVPWVWCLGAWKALPNEARVDLPGLVMGNGTGPFVGPGQPHILRGRRDRPVHRGRCVPGKGQLRLQCLQINRAMISCQESDELPAGARSSFQTWNELPARARSSFHKWDDPPAGARSSFQ